MRMNPAAKGAALVASLLTVAALTAGPARAETQTHKDPRGDVETVGISKAAPMRGIDVVELRNTYRGKKLKMSMTTVRLLESGYYAEWFIRTAESTYLLYFDDPTGFPTVTFYDLGPLPVRGRPHLRGEVPGCAGARAEVKGATLVASVPRGCFRGARTVKVAGVIEQPTQDGYNRDDSRRRGVPESGGLPVFGPKLGRS